MSPIAQKGAMSTPVAARPNYAVQELTLYALNRPSHILPLPSEPVVDNYGKRESKVAHHVHLYPAFLKRAGLAQGKELLEADESSCFYHPQFAATNMCSHSGRFICDLCSTEFNGEVISLQALSDIKAKGKVSKLDDTRKLWDDIALALLLVPFFAPIAIGICLWKWKQGPTSIVRKTRSRYVVAMVIGLIEILLLAWVFTGGLDL